MDDEVFGEDPFGEDEESSSESTAPQEAVEAVASTPSTPTAAEGLPVVPPLPVEAGLSAGESKAKAVPPPGHASTKRSAEVPIVDEPAAGGTKQDISPASDSVRVMAPVSRQSNQKFWDDHINWQRQVLKTHWRAAVRDPQSSGGFRSYTHYEVALQPMGYSVRRRYSDFLWLQETLSHRYVGVLVSSLPPKGGVMKGKNFLKLRMRALGIFLEKVIRNPYLRSDTSLMDFFSITDSKKWEQLKKAVARESRRNVAGTQTTNDTNIGECKWREAIDAFDMPAETMSKLEKIERQIAALERMMKAVLVSSGRLVERSRAYAAEMGEFKVAFEALMHTEQTSTSDTSALNSPELTAILSKMGSLFNAWHDVLKFQPGVNEMLLHEVFRFELQQVQAMKDLFKQRLSMTNAHTKATTALQNLELKQQNLISRGTPEKAQKLDKNIADAQNKLRRSKYVVDFMTKGLFFSELDRFVTDKVDAFRQMTGQFAAAHIVYSTRLMDMWKLSLQSIPGIDPREMIERANDTLEELDMLEGMKFQ